MVFCWLDEACAFLAGGDFLAIQPPSSFEDAISGTWAHGDNVLVEHHECQSSVTFQGMFVMEVNDRLFLPLLEPPVTRNLAIVGVDLPIAFLPLVVLAGAEFCPSQQRVGMERPLVSSNTSCSRRSHLKYRGGTQTPS